MVFRRGDLLELPIPFFTASENSGECVCGEEAQNCRLREVVFALSGGKNPVGGSQRSRDFICRPFCNCVARTCTSRSHEYLWDIQLAFRTAERYIYVPFLVGGL